MTMQQIEIAMRCGTPLKVEGSALRWTAERYVSEPNGNTKLFLRARCSPEKVRTAGPYEIEIA